MNKKTPKKVTINILCQVEDHSFLDETYDLTFDNIYDYKIGINDILDNFTTCYDLLEHKENYIIHFKNEKTGKILYTFNTKNLKMMLLNKYRLHYWKARGQ